MTSVTPIRRRVRVEEYLRRQKRYAHLFGTAPATDVIAKIQGMADANVARYGLVNDETVNADLEA